MPLCELTSTTWEELRELGSEGAVAVLPVGALEAHGPHLPLDTDVVIARAMAREGGRRLAERGRTVLLLPPLVYTPAPFAAGFPGTISIRPETLVALVEDIAASLAGHGIAALALANSHLDPTHVGALRAVAAPDAGLPLRVVFPDITRRHLAERLTDEFLTGACHAGRYETSIVLAEAPERVDDEVRAGLEPVTHSLSDAIREGKKSFEEVGGARAYFGDPAAATAEEGRRTIEALGRMLDEAVEEAMRGDSAAESDG